MLSILSISQTPESNISIEHVISALCYISGCAPTTTTTTNNGVATTSEIIKEAEGALLSWENTNPDAYAGLLLNIVLLPLKQGDEMSLPMPMLRLAALLSLKAMITRKWKDRGRARGRRNQIPVPMLSDEVKDRIRMSLLSIATTNTGGIDGQYSDSHGNVLDLLLNLMNDRTIQASVSSILSKIGRLDLPLQFQNLVPILIGFATGSTPIDNKIDPVLLRINTSNALEAILTEICVKRLLVDKKYVIAVAQENLSNIVSAGLTYSLNYLKTGISDGIKWSSIDSTHESHFLMVVHYATTMTKIMHLLLLSALPYLTDGTQKGGSLYDTVDNPAKAVDQIFSLTLEYIPLLLERIRKNKNSQENDSFPLEISENIEKLLMGLCDMTVDIQKTHSMAFIRFLNPFLSLFSTELTQINRHSTSSFDRRFAISTMLFLANVAGCSHYSPDEESNEAIETFRSETGTNDRRAISSKGDTTVDLSAVNNAVHTTWSVFFTPERICDTIDIAIRFMTLDEERLIEWNEDPENYYISELNRVAEDDLSACAQNLYLSLAESKNGRLVVAKKMSGILEKVDEQMSAVQSESGLNVHTNESNYFGDQSVLFWDAIYTAAGLSITILKEETMFNINTWFEVCIYPCLKTILQCKNTNENILPVLRNRLIWLIGCTYHLLKNRQNAFEALISVINETPCPQSFITVKLAAVQSLTSLLYDPDGSLETFFLYIDVTISSLYVLANNCVELESREQSLSCISLILTSVLAIGKQISASTADATVGPLAGIWQNSTDQNLLLRRNVLSILAIMASAVGKDHSGKLHPVALPMINYALDPTTRAEHIFLIDDALILWLTLLRLAPVYESNLDILFPRVKDLLEQDLDHVRILMVITEGYILLGDSAFLSLHSSTIQQILQIVIGQVSPRGVPYIYLVLEAILRKFPVEGGVLVVNAGIISTMLKACAANWFNVENCEPDRVIILYLTAISRILLSSQHVLDNFFPMPHDLGTNLMFTTKELIELYYKLFEFAGSGNSGILRQKLWTLFLLSLLPPDHNVYEKHLLSDMDRLLNNCLATIKQQNFVLNPFSVECDDDDEIYDNNSDVYDQLLKAHSTTDVGYTTDVGNFLKIKIQGLVGALGQEQHRDLIGTVEPNVLQQLEKIMK